MRKLLQNVMFVTKCVGAERTIYFVAIISTAYAMAILRLKFLKTSDGIPD